MEIHSNSPKLYYGFNTTVNCVCLASSSLNAVKGMFLHGANNVYFLFYLNSLLSCAFLTKPISRTRASSASTTMWRWPPPCTSSSSACSLPRCPPSPTTSAPPSPLTAPSTPSWVRCQCRGWNACWKWEHHRPEFVWRRMMRWGGEWGGGRGWTGIAPKTSASHWRIRTRWSWPAH